MLNTHSGTRVYPIIAPIIIPDQGFDIIAHPTPPGDVHLPSQPKPKPITAPITHPRIFFQLTCISLLKGCADPLYLNGKKYCRRPAAFLRSSRKTAPAARTSRSSGDSPDTAEQRYLLFCRFRRTGGAGRGRCCTDRYELFEFISALPAPIFIQRHNSLL